jgi:hypothetical protein
MPQRGKAATKRSAGFQPAVSPTSSRQTLDVTAAFELFPHLRIGNPRYSRLEALRYDDGLASPQISLADTRAKTGRLCKGDTFFDAH